MSEEDKILVCWSIIQWGDSFPGGLHNNITELWHWEPITDVDKAVYNIMRSFIHMSPRLFMRRARDMILKDIQQIKQNAYKQGKTDAIKLIQENL